MTKEPDWIELFAPQEILQDFDAEKLVEENDTIGCEVE